MIQQGRFMSLFSRILVRNAAGESSEQRIEALEKQVAEAGVRQEKLSADLLQTQQQNQTLQSQNTQQNQQLDELAQHNAELQQNLSETQRQNETLEQINRTELEHHTQTEQQQQQQITDLQTQLTTTLQEVQEKDKEIARVTEVKEQGYAEHKKLLEYAKRLKEEFDALKSSRKTKRVIAKYRASEELAEEIATEFVKGYREAMMKIKAAGADPKIVGFTDEDLLLLEDFSEDKQTEAEPSNQQPTNPEAEPKT